MVDAKQLKEWRELGVKQLELDGDQRLVSVEFFEPFTAPASLDDLIGTGAGANEPPRDPKLCQAPGCPEEGGHPWDIRYCSKHMREAAGAR